MTSYIADEDEFLAEELQDLATTYRFINQTKYGPGIGFSFTDNNFMLLALMELRGMRRDMRVGLTNIALAIRESRETGESGIED